MVATGGYEIRAVGTEGTVPYPALMACESGLERESSWFLIWAHGLHVLDFPNFGGVVGAACRQLFYVRREEDACDVFFMRREMSQGNELGSLVSLKELPYIDIALVLSIAVLPK